jgi:lysine biosynthesis protein LysW
MIGTCLECDENFEFDDDKDVGDVVQCPLCRAALEIVDLDPVILDYAEGEDA